MLSFLFLLQAPELKQMALVHMSFESCDMFLVAALPTTQPEQEDDLHLLLLDLFLKEQEKDILGGAH